MSEVRALGLGTSRAKDRRIVASLASTLDLLQESYLSTVNGRA